MPIVLLIDDDPDIQELVRALLERQGMEVRCAESAETGLRAATEHVPGVILLDVGLPDDDGFNLARQLRGRQALRNVPILFLTSANTVRDAEQGLQLGASDYITKPFDFEDLQRRVRRALDAAGRPAPAEKA